MADSITPSKPVQTLHQVTPHVFYLTPDHATDRPVLGVIAGDKAALVVDAGNSPAHANLLLEKLSGLGLPPLKYLALTHWHWDHVFGAATLDLLGFAHTETRRIVARMAGLDWGDAALDARVRSGEEIAFCRDNIKKELPRRSGLVIKPPEIGFSQHLDVDLGGVTCRLENVGGDHALDSSVVYVPQDKVLFFGDCLSEDYYSGEPSYTTAKLFPLIDRLLSFDVEFFLEGHAEEPLSRKVMEEDTNLLKSIGLEVQRTGEDRDAVLKALRERLGEDLSADALEIADAFLAGLRKMRAAAAGVEEGKTNGG